MGNRLTLRGNGIEIVYLAAAESAQVVTYREGEATTGFDRDQVAIDETAVGALVTIELERSPEFGVTSFSFFLPDLLSGRKFAEFHTLGIRKETRGALAHPAAQRIKLQAIALHGVAEAGASLL
jgi:hypothetical protein